MEGLDFRSELALLGICVKAIRLLGLVATTRFASLTGASTLPFAS